MKAASMRKPDKHYLTVLVALKASQKARGRGATHKIFSLSELNGLTNEADSNADHCDGA